MDCIVHGVLQAIILEWVAFPFSRGSSQTRNWTQVSCIAGRVLTSWVTKEGMQCFTNPRVLPGFLCRKVLTTSTTYATYLLPPLPLCKMCSLARCCCCLVTKSCPTLCDPMDCSPPGSSIHGIPQARVLEWVAISFSRGSAWPLEIELRSPTL